MTKTCRTWGTYAETPRAAVGAGRSAVVLAGVVGGVGRHQRERQDGGQRGDEQQQRGAAGGHAGSLHPSFVASSLRAGHSAYSSADIVSGAAGAEHPADTNGATV